MNITTINVLSVLLRHIKRLRNFAKGQTNSVENIQNLLQGLHPYATAFPLIRIGSAHDGGYLIPDDLLGINACFSPGVAGVADFELALARKNIISFMADYSVDGPPIQDPLFRFEKKFLGPVNTTTHMTLESWVSRNAPDENSLLLQMDIEGAEYGVIESTPTEIIRQFRIMTIEFHHLSELENTKSFKTMQHVFAKLLVDFDVVHIHTNSFTLPIRYQGIEIPDVVEITFLRKDRIKTKAYAQTFPHQLDRANHQDLQDHILPRAWFHSGAENIHHT